MDACSDDRFAFLRHLSRGIGSDNCCCCFLDSALANASVVVEDVVIRVPTELERWVIKELSTCGVLILKNALGSNFDIRKLYSLVRMRRELSNFPRNNVSGCSGRVLIA